MPPRFDASVSGSHEKNRMKEEQNRKSDCQRNIKVMVREEKQRTTQETWLPTKNQSDGESGETEDEGKQRKRRQSVDVPLPAGAAQAVGVPVNAACSVNQSHLPQVRG